MELQLSNKTLPNKSFLEPLLIMRILITLSMENLLSIYNRPEPVEIIPPLQPIPKLSTGEETTLFKKEVLQLEEMTDGLLPTTPTGVSQEPIT